MAGLPCSALPFTGLLAVVLLELNALPYVTLG